jgi:uncharacterized Tic20 family protein
MAKKENPLPAASASEPAPESSQPTPAPAQPTTEPISTPESSQPIPAPEQPAPEPVPAPETAPQPPIPAQPLPAPAYQPLFSRTDEQTWSMIAHLSVLLNLVTGFLGPVAALGIYLAYRDRSRYVAYQSLQSFIFQLIWWVGGGALIALIWAITGILSVIVIGILCIPFSLLLTLLIAAMPVVALVYGVIGAVETSQGKDFQYWLIGDWVRGTYLGQA